MYSILVVDDFALDRREIVETIQSFDDLPVFVCSECENGYEALEAIRNFQPDILICDIEMAGMTGIELASYLRKTNSDIHIVFYSLYDKVHYLRSVIQLNSDAYLMKPLSAPELRAGLEQILRQMMKIEQQEMEVEKLRQAMAENRISVIREFFSDVLFGGEISSINLEHRMRQLGFSAEQAFRVAMVDLNANHSIAMRNDQDNDGLIPYQVFRLLKSHSHEAIPYYVVHVSDKRFAMVFCFGAQQTAPQTRALVMQELRAFIERMRGLAISVSTTFGRQVDSVQELRSQYHLCCFRLNHRWQYNGDDIIFANENAETVSDPIPDMQMIQIELRMLLEMENENIAKSAEEFIDALFADMSTWQQQLICHYLLGNARLAMQENACFQGLGGKDFRDLAQEILSLNENEDCREYARKLIVGVYGILHQEADDENHALVEQIRWFIRESDLKYIQLRLVAEQFSYSPNYLNHIYKKATGSTILDFITTCRINRAKELMQTTDMNLSEIAEEIGYSHATYLSIVFKKFEGMTPKQYKKNYSESRQPARNGGMAKSTTERRPS